MRLAVCSISQISHSEITKSLSKYLLNAAKSLILLFWRSNSIPSIRDWLHRIKDICDMEETIAQSNDRHERYHKTWSPWFAFKYSQEYERLKSVVRLNGELTSQMSLDLDLNYCKSQINLELTLKYEFMLYHKNSS